MRRPDRGRFVWLLIAVTLSGSTASVPTDARAQNAQRTVAVSVLGRGDAPVPSLGIKDFTVREDGRPREVLRVEPAPPPPAIALLVDDSQAAEPLIRDLRSALTSFTNIMADESPVPAMRLTTFGARPTVRADFTPTFSAVSRAIDQIAPVSGNGAVLLEAIVETCRDLRTRKITGAVIVAFVVEAGPEFSNLDHRRVSQALEDARASLWTITLQDRGGSGTGDTERRERALVTDTVTVESGGRNKPILSQQQLPAAFAEVATLLLSRYAVTYGRPDALVPPTRLEIAGRDRSWKLQVPRWPPD